MIVRPKYTALLLLVPILGVAPIGAHAESGAPAAKVPGIFSSLFSSQPLQFELNRGQVEGPARFLARGVNYNFLIFPSETQLLLDKKENSTTASRREPASPTVARR